MPNVCDNNVYEAQTCASYYYLIVHLVKCTGRWHCGRTPKDELPDPRGSLANDILSCAIEQANQKVRQDNRQYQHPSNV